MNPYMEVTQKALEKNELDKLLLGEGEYGIKDPNFPSAAPTDINTVFEAGIHKLAKEVDEAELVDSLKAAIKKLLDGDAVSLWTAFNACWAQIYLENENRAAFTFADDNFRAYVSEKLNSQVDALKACKKYDGAQYENGLWEDITGANDVLVEDFGVTLL